MFFYRVRVVWQSGVGWRLKCRFLRWHFYGCFKISARIEEPFNLRVGSYRLHLFTLARQLLARRARLVNFTFTTPSPADTPWFAPVEPVVWRIPGRPHRGPSGPTDPLLPRTTGRLPGEAGVLPPQRRRRRIEPFSPPLRVGATASQTPGD